MCEVEYHQEAVPLTHLFQTCSAAGKDGWQLCATILAPFQVGTESGIVVAGAAGVQTVPGALLVFSRPKDSSDSLAELRENMAMTAALAGR